MARDRFRCMEEQRDLESHEQLGLHIWITSGCCGTLWKCFCYKELELRLRSHHWTRCLWRVVNSFCMNDHNNAAWGVGTRVHRLLQGQFFLTQIVKVIRTGSSSACSDGQRSSQTAGRTYGYGWTAFRLCACQAIPTSSCDSRSWCHCWWHHGCQNISPAEEENAVNGHSTCHKRTK